jgi:hypothetical protein
MKEVRFMEDNFNINEEMMSNLKVLNENLKNVTPGKEEYSRMVEDLLKYARFLTEREDKEKEEERLKKDKEREEERLKKDSFRNFVPSILKIIADTGVSIFATITGRKLLGKFIQMVFEFEETGAITSTGSKLVENLITKIKL